MNKLQAPMFKLKFKSIEHKKHHIMKKKLLIAISIIAVSSNLAFSQFSYQQSADGFFEKKYQEGVTKEWGTSAVFSDSRNTSVRAPLGSGLLLLAGMGLSYVFIRRKANDERLKTND